MIHPLKVSVLTEIQQKVERSLRLVVTKLQGGEGGSEVMKKQEVIRSKKLGGTTSVSRGRRKGYKKNV